MRRPQCRADPGRGVRRGAGIGTEPPAKTRRSSPRTRDRLADWHLGLILPSTWMVHGRHLDGKEKMVSVHELRPKAGETSEKVTINLGVVDLGQIDLLVQEGFYSNRTDLIRTAIRNQLASHADVVRETVARKTYVLGLQHYSRADLEAVKAAGQTLQIQVLGLASIAADVSPELALATIDSVVVLGALQASPEVKAALADRIR